MGHNEESSVPKGMCSMDNIAGRNHYTAGRNYDRMSIHKQLCS